MSEKTHSPTKRELFAAMAMQGVMANADVLVQIANQVGAENATRGVAQMAVEQADALLAELEQHA